MLVSFVCYKQCSFSLTFDVYEAIEEADRLEGKEVSQVFHAYFERVTVVQLEMCVHRKPQVFLYLLAQLVQQMLMEKRRPAKIMFPPTCNSTYMLIYGWMLNLAKFYI